MNAQRMNLFDHGVAQTDTCPLVPSEHGIVVASSKDLKVRRLCVRRRVGAKAAGLPAPVVIAPREQLVPGGRSRQPGTGLPIEPRLLLIRIVLGHERSKAVRAHIASHDQEIAWWDIRKEPVLIAEGNNSHRTDEASVASSLEVHPARVRVRPFRDCLEAS
jgi:hypothetical protein